MTPPHALARRALRAFDSDARIDRMYGHGENTTYKVAGRPWVLRVHRDGYHDLAELQSEADVLEALQEAGFHVGRHRRSLDGRRVVEVDGRHVTVLQRLPGRIGSRLGPTRARILGKTLFDLHAFARRWTPPVDFKRPHYTLDAMLGPNALWGSIEDAGVDPILSRDLRASLLEALSFVDDERILTHFDLHPGNIVWDGSVPGLIDWDDCGFGAPRIDLALSVERVKPHRRADVWEGYGCDPDPAFDAICLSLYMRGVGWLWSRREIPRLRAVLEDRMRPAFIDKATAWLA